MSVSAHRSQYGFKAKIDADSGEVTEGMEDHEKARMGGKWSTLEALARLIVEHFERRREAIEGKGRSRAGPAPTW